ncbi:MAG: AAA family ATPase [Bacteroidota bacterium]
MLVFLVGACGVGKSTLCETLRKLEASADYILLQSDSSPIPSQEEMEQEFGDWGTWQYRNTIKWIDRMVAYAEEQTVIWDGQANLDFITKEMANRQITNYRIVLIECAEEEMIRRLIEERKQAYLAHQDQKNWRNFLHRQAEEKGAYIIDTTNISPKEVAKQLLVYLEGTSTS